MERIAMEDTEPIHFSLLVRAPREVPITAEEHKRLSYFGLGSFMISYPLVFEDSGDSVIAWTSENLGWKYYRKDGIKRDVAEAWSIESCEMCKFKIMKDTELYKNVISTQLQHLFFKGE